MTLTTEISPKYLMDLIAKIEETLWDSFSTSKYKNVKNYIKKFQKVVFWDNFHDEYNFDIKYQQDGISIDLYETLHSISDQEIILKIVIDLGIETPGFVPVISTIKNTLKDDYPTAYESFNKAIKQIEEDPDLAISLSNSTLESIIKHICADEVVGVKFSKSKTLYDLTQLLLKNFQLFPEANMPIEIKTIGTSLLAVSQMIEKLRSEKTSVHGRIGSDLVIKDSTYAYFIVNTVSTVGLFLIHFYNDKYKKGDIDKIDNEKIEDMPF